MQNLKKFLKFEDIQLITVKEHPRDISRTHLKIIDEAHPNEQHKTFKYGHVEPTEVRWESPIQLPFQGQQSLLFQTVCQHEYGYEIQELKAMYKGVIYLRPDQFFFENTAYCLNQEGEQCGTLNFMVKVVERQFIIDHGQEKVDKKEASPKQPVKVDLVAKISIYGANLVINSYFANLFEKKKKRNLSLEIRFNSLSFTGQPKFTSEEYKWLLNSKFQVHDNQPQLIQCSVVEDDHPYLSGNITMSALEANKRFTVQVVQLLDQNDQNIAALHLDLRYISKKELLDLMYSPKQLADNKIVRKEEDKHHQQYSRVASSIGDLKIDKEKKLYNLLHNRSLSKQVKSSRNHSPIHGYRYRSRVVSDYQDTKIPKEKRFRQEKPFTNQMTVIDPSFLSDFSPPRQLKKGATQSSGNRNDFTRHSKDHPGVGQYHLPSIWERK